uniref:Potassium channel subfamily K member 18 (inferred by orthology to a human protein) n=1 Tax=Strongyloides venezuelensis TaxID=75913 RepID=A0A0K0FNB8_STRVS
MITTHSDGKRGFQKAKPITLHISLLFLVFIYAFVGGLVFLKLESEATEVKRREELTEKTKCLEDIFYSSLNKTVVKSNETISLILACFIVEADARSQWTFVTATLYGFGIVTTLGYNRIAPVTTSARLFCVIYGICGIPITMIIIANIGQYMNQFAKILRKKLQNWIIKRRARRRSVKSKGVNYGVITKEDINGNIDHENGEFDELSNENDSESSDSDDESSSAGVTAFALLIIFLLYVFLGALLLPGLNGRIDFLNGIYYNFLCLTAIDFGQLVPQNVHLLPITFLYVCIGLAITTIAIDVGSEYMKQLHYLGRKMKNVATTKIWFGGKQMKVKELLVAVTKKCGVDPNVIAHMNLENVVERVIAINEGREPPPDLNEHIFCDGRIRKSFDDMSIPHMDDEVDDDNYYNANGLVITKDDLPPPPMPPMSYEELPLLPRGSSGYCLMKQSSIKSDWSLKFNKIAPIQPTTPSCGDGSSLHDFEDQNNKFFEFPARRVPSGINFNYIQAPEETLFDLPPVLLSKGFESLVPIDNDFNIETFDLNDTNDNLIILQDSNNTIQKDDEIPSKKTSPTVTTIVTHYDKEPKRFREKKEKYARDANKLFQTYQEEWNRIEQLTVNKLGPRRKSVFDIHNIDKSVHITTPRSMSPSNTSTQLNKKHNISSNDNNLKLRADSPKRPSSAQNLDNKHKSS